MAPLGVVLVVACAQLVAGEWSPALGMKELDTLERALHRIADSPVLTGAQLASAKQVVADVESTVAAVQTGKGLTKEMRNKRLAAAIKELQGLQEQWALAASGNKTAIEERLHALQGELAEKRALLNRTQSLLKLAKLNEELARKKLQLKSLLDSKAKAEALERDARTEAEQRSIDTQLVAAAHGAAAHGNSSGKRDLQSTVLQRILVSMKLRAQNVTLLIQRLDAEEKKREASLEGMIKSHMSAQGGDISVARNRAIFKMISKKAQRAYRKKRAVQEAELAELKEGIHSIEARDLRALRKLMSKMQQEAKTLQARSRSFIY